MFPYVPDENVLGDEEEKKKGSYVLNILHATCSLSRIFLQNKEIILVWYDAVLIEPLGQWWSLYYISGTCKQVVYNLFQNFPGSFKNSMTSL